MSQVTLNILNDITTHIPVSSIDLFTVSPIDLLTIPYIDELKVPLIAVPKVFPITQSASHRCTNNTSIYISS